MDDFKRYARQMILPEIGKEGQKQLSAARVLCIGAGGLGCPALLYLAGAGVGHIGIVDNDMVDESNLQRQPLYTTKDIGQPKTDAAKKHLAAFNPQIEITVYAERLTAENTKRVMAPFDIILDGSDNFATRFLVNDACVMLKKPLIYGSVQKFEGQASVFDATRGPCYRCLFPKLPTPGMGPSCAEAGVLGVVPGLIGMIQATETLKLILGTGEVLVGRLLVVDALCLRFHELIIPKDAQCPCCGRDAKQRGLINYDAGGCMMNELSCITAKELRQKIEAGEEIVLVDVREPDEHAICKIPGSRLIPLKTLPQHCGDLNPDAMTVVYCHHGRRGQQAYDLLRDRGFKHLFNLTGGIHAWAEDCDPKMTRY